MLHHTIVKDSPFLKPIPRPVVILGMVASLGILGITTSRVLNLQLPQSEPASQVSEVEIPQVKTVTALGRLEPAGEVIKLSAPASSQGSRVERLLVNEGDKVKVGQVIAILDNRDRLQAAYEKSKEAVEVAQANLAKVQAGAKEGEIEAQKAEIARIQAQSLGEERAQRETLARLEAQWQGDKTAQQAALARLEAQWEGDKRAQQATIKRLEAELNNAKSEFHRYEQLYKEGAIAQSVFDSKRLAVDTLTEQIVEAKAILARTDATGSKQINEAKANLERITATGSKQINEAKAVLARIQATGSQQVSSAQATLNKIAEVRPVDVAAAQAEIRQAIAAEKEAKANLDQAYVKSPQDGVIFKIHTRDGETVSNEGIAEIGQVSQMMVVAEVYQSDVRKIELGQKVRIESSSLPGELYGKVDRIGWQIERQNVINSDPSENIDSRVVEVHVRLNEESSQKAAKFTNLQVKATIEL
ncbi:efflux RND transporter periplasmic adaptor subunit [Aerosakkonema sp. BLCC-F183]|uniref:efflux RND transporter periplasmic adaptor subunit n=1 Tax=Aerosakkonema sp. BLCC-F183 TaxID=3342834 RepID=UPI0035B7DCE1